METSLDMQNLSLGTLEQPFSVFKNTESNQQSAVELDIGVSPIGNSLRYG